MKTSKGFKIIPLNSLVEVNKLFNSPGICDSCNSTVYKGKYIAVLNSCYCEECFEKWHQGAVYYKEDSIYEDKNFEFYFNRAKDLGIAEDLLPTPEQVRIAKQQKEQERIDSGFCPECVTLLNDIEGCQQCVSCGWSPCD